MKKEKRKEDGKRDFVDTKNTVVHLDSVIQFARAFCVSFDGSVAMPLGETRTWNVSAMNMSIVKVVLVYSTS